MRTAVTDTAVAGHFKDAILDRLASRANVAQFVSFGPGEEPTLRFAHIKGQGQTVAVTVEGAVGSLLAVAGQVNVRSFDPDQPRSHEFIYGLTDARGVAREVRRLGAEGLHTIVNETIDMNDGGVSGVAYGGVVEFAPDDTPRAVEKPGTAAFPQAMALRLLERVYGFTPALKWGPETRVEFSIHPLKRGLRHEHTIVWELEDGSPIALSAEVAWPNRFSRLLGDKVFGLLVADALDLRVPLTRVFSRRVAPFEFGRSPGSGEHWIRTAPIEQVPGRFTTQRGWIDPFALMAREDPNGDFLAAVIAQEGVEAAWSGAAASTQDGVTVEGVAGTGEAFMQGDAPPERLPRRVVQAVEAVLAKAVAKIGPVRLEWAHDGARVWVLQLHRGGIPAHRRTIYPGNAEVEHRFRVEDGLEALRALVDDLQGTEHGVVLVGSVGVTSHFGDVLRRARIPSRIEPMP